MAVSSKQTDHHTISCNILLFQIHQKLKRWCGDCSLQICDKPFSGCYTTIATAHIFGHPVSGQAKAGIPTCITINKRDGDKRALANLKNEKQALSEVMRGKEEAAAGKKQKQALMDEILTPYPAL